MINGSALTYRYLILLNRFLLVEIPDTQKYIYLVIVVFTFKCVNVDDMNNKKTFLVSNSNKIMLLYKFTGTVKRIFRPLRLRL